MYFHICDASASQSIRALLKLEMHQLLCLCMNKITFTGNKLRQHVMHFEAIYGSCAGGNKEVYEQDLQRADRHVLTNLK